MPLLCTLKARLQALCLFSCLAFEVFSSGFSFADESPATRSLKTPVPEKQGADFANSIGMKFKLIPAGTFMMGSPPDEKGSQDDERQHQVTISKPYFMGGL